MGKPIIGIVGSVFEMESCVIKGTERAYVGDDYIKAIECAGGVPVVLPVIDDSDNIKMQMEMCNGVLLTGGQDIHPKYYGEDQHKRLGHLVSRVDQYQLKLAQMIIEADKPVLGICRGLQIMNVAFNGSLYQDLKEKSKDVLKHFQSGKRFETAHRIRIDESSKIHSIFGAEIMVNSYHHQGIKDLGQGLTVVAKSADGVIEAIEMKDKKFVLGVQWHPEMLLAGSKEMLPLFEALVEEAKK